VGAGIPLRDGKPLRPTLEARSQHARQSWSVVQCCATVDSTGRHGLSHAWNKCLNSCAGQGATVCWSVRFADRGTDGVEKDVARSRETARYMLSVPINHNLNNNQQQ
jgi:hypothetical protein